MRPPRFPAPNTGFSLVEITVALGLLSFALLAIVGLLGVGLSSGKSAQVDTVQAAVAQSAADIWRASVADNPSLFDSASGTNLFFTYDGLQTNAAAAYFTCNLTQTLPGSDVSADATNDFRRLTIKLIYPKSTNVLHASLVRPN